MKEVENCKLVVDYRNKHREFPLDHEIARRSTVVRVSVIFSYKHPKCVYE